MGRRSYNRLCIHCIYENWFLVGFIHWWLRRHWTSFIRRSQSGSLRHWRRVKGNGYTALTTGCRGSTSFNTHAPGARTFVLGPGKRFDTPYQVWNIFPNMLQCLKAVMNYAVIWLPKSRIQSSMPQSFIDSGHDDTTCLFEFKEVSLERPKKQRARSQTKHSTYKSNN